MKMAKVLGVMRGFEGSLTRCSFMKTERFKLKFLTGPGERISRNLNLLQKHIHSTVRAGQPSLTLVGEKLTSTK